MKTLITLFALLALTLIAAAQPPDTLWTRTYGGSYADNGRNVQQTSDGGYIIAGCTNSFGSGFQVYLIKTDAAGDSVWTRTFGGSNSDYGYSVLQTSDGGYVITGYTNSFGSGFQVYLIKTDAAGDSVWTRTFGGSSSDHGNSVQQTSDGGYVIAGVTNSYGTGYQVYLIKTDTSGDLVWERTFGGSGDDYGYSVQQTTDGGYVIAGQTDFYGTGNINVSLIKTDAAGYQVWQCTFGGSGGDEGYSVQQTSDGGYVIAGETASYGAGYTDVYLIKTDEAGNLVWQRTFGGSYHDFGYSVLQTSDGGYVIAGTTYSYGAYYYNVYLIKTDAAGNQVWQQTHGGDGVDYGYSVQQTSDGGYVIAGWTTSFGAGSSDVYLIKTDAGGVPLDLTTSPVNPPIVIPRNGGNFQYNIIIHNLTTQPQTFSVWNKVRTETGFYIQVFGPVTRTLPGGANPTRILTQTVAATIPAGTLYFISYIGTYPSTIADSSFFTITKLATGDGGPWIAESQVTGDCFDEYKDVGVGAHGMRQSGSEAGQQGVQLNAPTQPQVTDLHLSVNPNPFNPTTVIRFTLPEAAKVTLEVFDINGRDVGAHGMRPVGGGDAQGARSAPLQAWFSTGSHEISFDGSGLPSGVYIYRLQVTSSGSEATPTMLSGKMVLLK